MIISANDEKKITDIENRKLFKISYLDQFVLVTHHPFGGFFTPPLSLFIPENMFANRKDPHCPNQCGFLWFLCCPSESILQLQNEVSRAWHMFYGCPSFFVDILGFFWEFKLFSGILTGFWTWSAENLLYKYLLLPWPSLYKTWALTLVLNAPLWPTVFEQSPWWSRNCGTGGWTWTSLLELLSH